VELNTLNPGELAMLAVEEHGAWQKPDELAVLALVVSKLKPQRVLEIGTHKGGTLWLWSQLATDDAMIVTVDLDHTTYEQGHLARNGQHILFVEGDSLLSDTQLRVERMFGREPVDLLFIDGAHTYHAVMTDWQAYRPLVRDGGMIVFHDIIPADNPSEVHIFWEELKEASEKEWAEQLLAIHEVTEIISKDFGRWGGIGVVRV
jgi:cephalosporin hydroxylase